MSGPSTYEPKSGFTRWLDDRLPIIRLGWDSFVDFPTPRNLNYWWTFGGILAVFLMIQIITGIILAMHYVPHESMAFESVERIRRDVNFGWMIQSMHANGAAFFFVAVYLHMFRGLYYGSYKAPREILWILGVVIYLLMMATAFMGYVLPWGQMSYWGAMVITNLIGALPFVGDAIREWLWGGFSVGQSTLNRFFSLHYLLPFVIAGVVGLHIWALHVPGNGNPVGLDVRKGDSGKKDTLPFHPYYTVKDGFAIIVYLMVFATFVFFMPNVLGHADNFIEANPLSTPAHIVPEWYFLPFYAILRAVTFDIGPIDAKLGGVLAMFGAIAILFVLPWLDTSKVRSMRYRPLTRWFFIFFVLACLGLGLCGAKNPDDLVFVMGQDAEGHEVGFKYLWLGQLLTVYYFAYFVVVLPLMGIIEKPKERPASIEAAVLGTDKS
ncbi:MAG: cytochrome b N-terminal domain-containing protein [Maricaulis sp.]|uniref:cytochrome b n=1 Tax=Maricaulis sp. TaxID=1486257 RepID=UPI00261F46BF|nr:cytochrome b N-terminal domain-containing protein [Maricaulis sp.]MDM7985405.1 cytochrome b N-terminal domain-containing protein [Maricaulis sp.]